MNTRSIFTAVAVATALVGTTASHAAPVTMDFDGLTGSGLESRGNTYTEDGFQLASTGPYGLYSIHPGDGRYTGSVSMFNNSDNGRTTLSQVGGGAFELNSIDLDSLNGGTSVKVTFVASLLGGGTASQMFETDSAFPALQAFNFGSAFANVTAVSWRQLSPYHSFDNIQINQSQVPEPGTLALLSIAMLGVAVGRRNLTKKV